MKEACNMWFSVMCAIIVVCGLVFGAYCLGTATQTHLTLIVERLPIQDSYQDMALETATKASKPAGIYINDLPTPQRKPAVSARTK